MDRKKEKECVTCGSSFEVTRFQTNKRYCSAKCNPNTRKPVTVLRVDSCLNCGTPFEVTSKTPHKKNCSPECSRESIRKPVTVLKEDSCPNCGIPVKVMSNQPGKKYCSEKCRAIANKAKTDGNKFVIFNRDGFRCQFCGDTPADGIRLVCDHIHPYNRGGGHTAGNLVTSCEPCNSSKSDRLLEGDSLCHILSSVEASNKRDGIPPGKIIRGSHTRGDV